MYSTTALLVTVVVVLHLGECPWGKDVLYGQVGGAPIWQQCNGGIKSQTLR